MAFQSIIASLLSFIPGQRLVDGGDCLALALATASGQTGVTALAGGAQAISANNGNLMQYAINEISTVGTTADSVIFPFAIQGKTFSVINSGANSANMYPNPALNPANNTADQTQTTSSASLVSNSTAIALAAGAVAIYECARTGVWKRVV